MPTKRGAQYECSLCRKRTFSAEADGPDGWELSVLAFSLEDADVCDECRQELLALIGWLKRGRRGPRDMDAGDALRTLPRDEGRAMDLRRSAPSARTASEALTRALFAGQGYRCPRSPRASGTRLRPSPGPATWTARQRESLGCGMRRGG